MIVFKRLSVAYALLYNDDSMKALFTTEWVARMKIPCFDTYMIQTQYFTRSFAAFLSLALITMSLGACGKEIKNCSVSQLVETPNETVGIADTALGGDELAQSFKVSEDKEVNTIALKLIKLGTLAAANTLTVTIVADSGTDTPDTTVLTSGSLSVANIGTSATQFYSVTISSINLKKNTKYWLRVKASYAASTTNLIKWASNTSNVLPDDRALYETAIAENWNTTAIGTLRDFVFSIGTECS